MLREVLERLRETHLATRLDRWMTGAIAALLVALGFIAGRWTSLTTNATPIVFQEAPGDRSSAASPEDLKGLVAGSERAREESGTAQRQAEPESRPPPAAPRGSGAFVASANGEKYYTPDCPEVRRIKPENLISFDSEQEARDSGYEPSQCVLKRRSP